MKPLFIRKCKLKSQWTTITHSSDSQIFKKSTNQALSRMRSKGNSHVVTKEYKLVQPLWKTIWQQLIKLSQRRQWHPTPALLLGKSHGWRSLVGCSPWGRKESDTTERLHSHFSLSYIGEGNGSPLQCSCLENPRDGGVWWAAIYGVAQSWTQLKRLSSSSSKAEHALYMFTYPLQLSNSTSRCILEATA